MKSETRVAIVTGGGQGIGKATSRALLESGYAVIIAESDREAGRETEREYHALGSIRFMQTDIADEGSVKALSRGVIREFRRIDLLVNNAAISANKPLTTLSLKDWNRVISVNLTGVFLCAKHAARYLKKTKGSMVNIASTRALMSERDTEAYSASKGGILALSHSLAVSLGPDIRVNCICPGWIDVSGWKKKRDRKKITLSGADHAQHSCGRVGKPEDIASLVLYLASPASGFITGANFVVDGGMTRKMIYV
ncbi:MAG TPA: SDR family oxidoreductase [Thermodesulfovibrionales bacterium]|nr:SDR family oxidoreductase [Thermodesulfovibrionales bacterium]